MPNNSSDTNSVSTNETLSKNYGTTEDSFQSGIPAENSTAANSATSSTATNAKGSSTANAASTIAGIFNTRDTAERAVNELRSQGFTSEEINIVSKKNQSGSQDKPDGFYDDDISDGALTGSALGGIGGLILGAGALAIPGVGPIIAAGPIAAAISATAAGGLAGGLIDWGIPSEAGEHYQQQVAQGNILAIVRTTSGKVRQAAQIMRRNGAQDVQSHQGEMK